MSVWERAWGALARLYDKGRVRALLFAGLLLLIGATMLLLNLHTPLQMDDYDYRISWATGESVHGLADVIASQAAHYRLWGGRSVVHAIAQLFLQADKRVFDVFNTLAYLALLLEIYALCKRPGRRFCFSLLLAAHAALFFLVPFFGTAFLWLTGACNYLWGTALALLPLLLLRRGRAWPPLAFLCGLIAGWTNENTAPAVLALVALRVFADARKGEKPRAWRLALLAGQATGIALMLLAPGNFARASGYAAEGSPAAELLARLLRAAAYGVVYLGLLAVAALLLSGLLREADFDARRARALWLFAGAAIASAAMIASPVLSDRSYTGAFALALAGALTLLSDFEASATSMAPARMAALPLAVCLMLYGGYGALRDVTAHEDAWNAQLARAEAAIISGEDEATLSSVPSHSRFTMDIALSDDPALWPNAALSRALGIAVRGEGAIAP